MCICVCVCVCVRVCGVCVGWCVRCGEVWGGVVRCGEVWVIGVGQLVWVGRSGSDGRSEAGWVGRRRSRSGEPLYDI